MSTIDLESLNIFRTVVEEGGVVRAVAKFNRVQSNVTTRRSDPDCMCCRSNIPATVLT